MASDWRQRQKEELRRSIYNTAVQLFEVNGYERTTVQQITEAVGIAKGTFFNHFPSKEHVVLEWYNRITTESITAARERDTTTAEQAVSELVVDMVRRATDAPELLVAKSMHSSSALLMAAEQAQDAEIDNFVRERCEAGKVRGELADDLDCDFFADLLVSVLTGSSRAWVRERAQFDFPTIIRQRLQFLFRAAARH